MLGSNLFQTMTVDVNTMIFVFIRVVPVAVGKGYLGHLIGKILDNPRGNIKKK